MEAKRVYQQCLAADVEPNTALMSLGFRAERADETDEATGWYEQALAADETNSAPACLGHVLSGGPRDGGVDGHYRLALASEKPNARSCSPNDCGAPAI